MDFPHTILVDADCIAEVAALDTQDARYKAFSTLAGGNRLRVLAASRDEAIAADSAIANIALLSTLPIQEPSEGQKSEARRLMRLSTNITLSRHENNTHVHNAAEASLSGCGIITAGYMMQKYECLQTGAPFQYIDLDNIGSIK